MEFQYTRYQFGLRSLFGLTLLVACILSVLRFLGPAYGMASVVPLGTIAISSFAAAGAAQGPLWSEQLFLHLPDTVLPPSATFLLMISTPSVW